MLRIVTFIPGKLDMDFSGLCVLMCTCKTVLKLTQTYFECDRIQSIIVPFSSSKT